MWKGQRKCLQRKLACGRMAKAFRFYERECIVFHSLSVSPSLFLSVSYNLSLFLFPSRFPSKMIVSLPVVSLLSHSTSLHFFLTPFSKRVFAVHRHAIPTTINIRWQLRKKNDEERRKQNMKEKQKKRV